MKEITKNINILNNLEYSNLATIKGISSYQGSIQVIKDNENYLLLNQLAFNDYKIQDISSFIKLSNLELKYKNYISEYNIKLKNYSNSLYKLELNNIDNTDYYKFLAYSGSDKSKLKKDINYNNKAEITIYENSFNIQTLDVSSYYISNFNRILYNAYSINTETKTNFNTIFSESEIFNYLDKSPYYNYYLSNTGKIILESSNNIELIPNNKDFYDESYEEQDDTTEYSNYDKYKVKIHGNLQTKKIKSNNIYIYSRQSYSSSNPSLYFIDTNDMNENSNSSYIVRQFFDSSTCSLSFELLENTEINKNY